MAKSRRVRAALALLATTSLLVTTACSKSDTPSGNELYKNPVTITWWHNFNTDGEGKTLWAKIANDFHALHPTVTIEVVPIETNDLQRNRLPAALLTNDPPDVFQAWGGGEMVEQVAAGYVKDITDLVQPEVASIGAAAKIWSVDGKQYGLPYNFGVEGFWYNKDIFKQAGIAAPPTTFDDLKADITKLKTVAGVAPISVGAGDSWPAAHWWYNFALHDCSASAVQAAATKQKFDDPCFIKAGDDLKSFLDLKAFQDGFLGTPGQTGAGSSAGMVANGKAAMELMGHWNSGVIQGLTADKKVPSFLGWFPFPTTSGTPTPSTVMGGGDGYAVSKNAPPEAVEFLKYLVNLDNQKAFAATGAGIPVVKGAEAGLTDPNLQAISKTTQSAPAVNLWLDTLLGAKAGTPMNTAIVAIFAGSGTPQGVVDALKKATQQ
jgi:raffinose/stachyose/melibiose transport system substrate-binding protein